MFSLQTVRHEGLMALYKGFIPTWVRMGPWNIIFFVTYEQMKRLYWSKYLLINVRLADTYLSFGWVLTIYNQSLSSFTIWTLKNVSPWGSLNVTYENDCCWDLVKIISARFKWVSSSTVCKVLFWHFFK